MGEARLFEVIAAHCIFCPHVERGATPEAVHDQMERHYHQEHAARIAELVKGVTVDG